MADFKQNYFQKRTKDRGPKANNRINALEVQVISSDGKNLGVLETREAIKIAKEEGLDLIEISPNAKPPVCKIIDYGKYNSGNFDTIFTKNVIVNYVHNKITGEYLEFSLERNSLLISKKVVYTNLENVLRADALEMNIKTKDTKIFMYEKQKKVNVKSIN